MWLDAQPGFSTVCAALSGRRFFAGFACRERQCPRWSAPASLIAGWFTGRPGVRPLRKVYRSMKRRGGMRDGEDTVPYGILRGPRQNPTTWFWRGEKTQRNARAFGGCEGYGVCVDDIGAGHWPAPCSATALCSAQRCGKRSTHTARNKQKCTQSPISRRRSLRTKKAPGLASGGTECQKSLAEFAAERGKES